jgi:type I restriction enzyme R subunit
VKSVNFEFLRLQWPELASLAGFAEQYAYTDPAAALVKLRSFAEQVVETIYEQFNLQKPIQPRLMDLLSELRKQAHNAFKAFLPDEPR